MTWIRVYKRNNIKKHLIWWDLFGLRVIHFSKTTYANPKQLELAASQTKLDSPEWKCNKTMRWILFWIVWGWWMWENICKVQKTTRKVFKYLLNCKLRHEMQFIVMNIWTICRDAYVSFTIRVSFTTFFRIKPIKIFLGIERMLEISNFLSFCLKFIWNFVTFPGSVKWIPVNPIFILIYSCYCNAKYVSSSPGATWNKIRQKDGCRLNWGSFKCFNFV